MKRVIGAVEVNLTAGDLEESQSGASKIEVQGERLPEAALNMTGK